MTVGRERTRPAVRLGLQENWRQFVLLVTVNFFVGGMVGLERTVLPLVGTEEFGLTSELVTFSFIIAFGVVKAVGNLASGVLADRFTRRAVLIAGWAVGLRPAPFWLGIGYAVIGMLLSVLLVRDTRAHADLEAHIHHSDDSAVTAGPSTWWVITQTSWRDRTLFGASQAGLVNNLNDGMSWGVLPVLFAAGGLGLAEIGVLKAVYPIIWGVGQIGTGPLADRIGRKPLIVSGMFVQAVGLAVIGFGMQRPFASGMAGSVLLGVGTAMVYPALLAAVGDRAHPAWRATSVGVYRTWRDLGYAAGALMAGLVATALDLVWAVHVAAVVTLAAGLVAWRVMTETAVGARR